jgi:hypothetical protein
MKLPYFLWNLKYNSVSFPLEDTEEELQQELTELIAVKNNLVEIVKSYELKEKYVCRYNKDSKNLHLKDIEDNNRVIQYNLDKLYREMALLEKHNSLTEEEFLLREADKKVISSNFFAALKSLINLNFQKLISEEEQWKYIDELRDIIYDFQEKELKELAEKALSSDRLLHRFVTFIKKGLCEIDESLTIIERAFEEKKFSMAEKGLLKARDGYVKIKTVEIIGEGELL